MRTHVWRLALSVGIALTLIAGAAMAQPPGGGQRGQRAPGVLGFGRAMSATQLLRVEKVQKELELTDDQKAQLDKLNEEMRAKMREAFQGGGQDREAARERMQAMQKEIDAGLEKILLPNQLKRLKEIRLQVAGINAALMDEEVRKELNVSEEQVQKIRDAVQKVMEEMRGQRPQQGERPDPAQMRERMQQMRQKMQEATMSVLTPEQKEKWEKMCGEKFEIDPSELFRGPAGPGGAPGGRTRGGNRGA